MRSNDIQLRLLTELQLNILLKEVIERRCERQLSKRGLKAVVLDIGYIQH